jgi:hypothetical protein
MAHELGLALGAAIELWGDPTLEVFDRPRDGGYGDSVAVGGQEPLGLKRGTTVEVDSAALLASRGAWDRDVDWSFKWVEELPEDRGGGVAQDRLGTASENCGHEASVEVRCAVSHGVDALVDAVEVALAKALGDRVLSDAYLTKLPRSNNAMLLRSDSGEVSPRGVAFFPHGWE